MRDKQLRKALVDAGMLYEGVHQVATTMSIKNVHVLHAIPTAMPNLDGISSQLSQLHLRINALAEALGYEFKTYPQSVTPQKTVAVRKDGMTHSRGPCCRIKKK